MGPKDYMYAVVANYIAIRSSQQLLMHPVQGLFCISEYLIVFQNIVIQSREMYVLTKYHA